MVTHFHTNPLKPYLRVLPSLHFHPHPHPISARQVSISRQLPPSGAWGPGPPTLTPFSGWAGEAARGPREEGRRLVRLQAPGSPQSCGTRAAAPERTGVDSQPPSRCGRGGQEQLPGGAASRSAWWAGGGGRVRGRLCPGSQTPSGLPARWGPGYFQPFREWSPQPPTNPVSSLLQNPSQVSALGKSQSLLDFSLTYYPLTLLRIKN